MEKITGSVGRTGDNRPADVTLIQKLLNSYKIPGETMPLQVSGKIDDKTYKRIEAFQKKILFVARPDGRIDPNGKSFKKLVSARVGAKAANTYTLSTKGINLLKSIEELSTKPYDDQTGKEIISWL